MKNSHKVFANMEWDRRTFISVSILNESKAPASLPPLITKHNEVNQTCNTLIAALDEVKARDLEHFAYDLLAADCGAEHRGE